MFDNFLYFFFEFGIIASNLGESVFLITFEFVDDL